MVGSDNLPVYNLLTVEGINEDVITQTENFLTQLKRFYYNRFNEADARRAATTRQIKSQLKNPEDLPLLRGQYQNETIREMVSNDRSVDRIVEDKGKLVQKLYPIYMWPEADHFLDFRTQFLVAYKPIFGIYMDTFVFNVLAIWVMTTFLFILLFYDVLGRLVLR